MALDAVDQEYINNVVQEYLGEDSPVEMQLLNITEQLERIANCLEHFQKVHLDVRCSMEE